MKGLSEIFVKNATEQMHDTAIKKALRNKKTFELAIMLMINKCMRFEREEELILKDGILTMKYKKK